MSELLDELSEADAAWLSRIWADSLVAVINEVAGRGPDWVPETGEALAARIRAEAGCGGPGEALERRPVISTVHDVHEGSVKKKRQSA